MRVLALDTALAACSAAFAVDGQLRGHRHVELGTGHAERLMPMVEAARHDAGLEYRELDLIAVTFGPGTFTGVRIGLAAARALALPHATPIAGVGTLQAIAWGAEPGTPLLVAIDARRGQFYVQAFTAALDAAGPPRLESADEIVAHGAGDADGLRLAGSGGPFLSARLGGASLADAADEPDAAVIAGRAETLAATARPGEPPAPLYLRAPDARLPGTVTPA